MIKEMICIGCPMGCSMEGSMEQDEVVEVKGNSCKRGEEYAKKECTNSTRILTSSIKVLQGEIRMLPVKTAVDIPKEKIWECIKEIKELKVSAPIKVGEVVLKNIGNTGVNLVATREVKAM